MLILLLEIVRSTSQPNTPSPTPTKAPIKTNVEAINVDVLVTYWMVDDKDHMVTMAGLCFDHNISDVSSNSNHLIEQFIEEHESIHKVHLPMPKDAGADYRKMFLAGAGYDTPENLSLLTYARCITHNPTVGDIDAIKFKYNTDVCNRRFPGYFINVPNFNNSNADEFNQPLRAKFEILLRILKETQFTFSSKGNLKNRKINYVFHEAENDLTNYRTSKEYKQLKLLLACAISIKQNKLNRMALSPQKIESINDAEVVPLKSINRTSVETSLPNKRPADDEAPAVDDKSKSKKSSSKKKK